MKIYRLSYRGKDGGVVAGEHGGYDYVSSKRKAAKMKARAADHDQQVEEIKVIEVEISKRGILRALNRYGDHPDNG